MVETPFDARARDDLARRAIDLALRWVAEAATSEPDAAATRLDEILADPDAGAFLRALGDDVLAPTDLFVAGYGLQRAAREAPSTLPARTRALLGSSGVLGPVIPAAVVPLARRVTRGLFSHLVLDARPERLGAALSALRESGRAERIELSVLGAPVHGGKAAGERFQAVRSLLERPDVDAVTLSVASVIPPRAAWDFDDAVDHAVARITPLLRLAQKAAEHGERKVVTLAVERHADLDLTVAVLTRLLENPSFNKVEAGIALPARLPASVPAVKELTAWARTRVAAGGAPLVIGLVEGDADAEHAEALLRGWPSAAFDRRVDVDATRKRIAEWLLAPDRAAAVRLVVPGHDLFDVAYAWLLAEQNGTTDALAVRFDLGVQPEQAAAVARTVASAIVTAPVVPADEQDAAFRAVIRRVVGQATEEGFLSAAPELHANAALLERERNAFLASASALSLSDADPEQPRTQNRSREWRPAEAPLAGSAPVLDDSTIPIALPAPADPLAEGLTQQVMHLGRPSGERPGPFDTTRVFTAAVEPVSASDDGMPGFANTPDTDPSIPANREWAARVRSRVARSRLGDDVVAESTVTDADALRAVIDRVHRVGAAWGRLPGADRAGVLDRAADAVAAHRDTLIEAVLSEDGAVFHEADAEVSAAVDHARYAAASARQLDRVQGAVFEPVRVTLVAGSGADAVADAAAGALAALAAGSAVVLVPEAAAARRTAVLAETLWEAGVSRDVLALAVLSGAADAEGSPADAHALLCEAVSDARVDRVVLTADRDTARSLRARRHDLELVAETGGRAATIVMPSADADRAVDDIVASAFARGGRDRAASSLVILVGSVGRDTRLLSALEDAVRSARPGTSSDARTTVAPLREVPAGETLRALTELDEHEQWVVEPSAVDATRLLWSPGLRTGVQEGSAFHLSPVPAPVIGIMRARTLADAVRLANAGGNGLVTGLETRDPQDVEDLLATAETAGIVVNAPTTGRVVQRHPFGGRRASAVGRGLLSGGPSRLFAFGTWRTARGTSSSTLHLRGLDKRISSLIESAQPSIPYEEFDVLRRSALSDAVAWAGIYGEIADAAGLGIERNLLRHRPVPVAIRALEGTPLGEVLRVVIAGIRARAAFSVSVATGLPTAVLRTLDALGIVVIVEADADWIDRVRTPPVIDEAQQQRPERVRLIGPTRAEVRGRLVEAVGGDLDVTVYADAVTQSGRVELLPFLREQAVTIAAEDHGVRDPWSDDVI